MQTKPIPKFGTNAEREFRLSGLLNTPLMRRIIRAEAMYIMNHINCRFSSAIQMACGNFKDNNLGSDIARGIAARGED